MGKKTSVSKRLSKLESTTRPEIKYRSAGTTGFTGVGSTVGTLIQPQQLSLGTARDVRIGEKVKTRNIRFQAILKMPANPNNATCAVRILILRSKKSYPGTGDMPTWYGSVDEDKFFVVKDILTQVSAIQARTVGGTSYQTGSTIKKLKLNIPVGLRKMQYDSGSGLTAPVNNEYVIYMLAENADAQVVYNWQHYYIDN